MDFLKSTLGKILLYAALAAVPIGYGYYVANGKDGQITELKESVKAKDTELEARQVKITNLNADLKEAKSQLQDQKTIRETEDKIRQTTDKLSNAEKLIDTAVADINKKYDALPKNDVNAEARKRAISQERVKGLWLSYCLAYPKNVRCVTAAPAAAASAASAAAK